MICLDLENRRSVALACFRFWRSYIQLSIAGQSIQVQSVGSWKCYFCGYWLRKYVSSLGKYCLTFRFYLVLKDNAVSASAVVGFFTFLGLFVNVLTLGLWYKRKAYIPTKHHDYERRLIFLTVVIYSLHLMSVWFTIFDVDYLIDYSLCTIRLNTIFSRILCNVTWLIL